MTPLHHWFVANIPHGKIPSELYPTYPLHSSQFKHLTASGKMQFKLFFTQTSLKCSVNRQYEKYPKDITLVRNPSIKRKSFRTPCEPICLKFSNDVAQLLFVLEKKKRKQQQKKKKTCQSFLSTKQFRLHVNKDRVRLSESVFPCVHLQGLVAKHKSTFLIVFPAADFTAYCKVQWTGSCTEPQLQFFTSIKKKNNQDLDTVHTYLSTELKHQTGTAVVRVRSEH